MTGSPLLRVMAVSLLLAGALSPRIALADDTEDLRSLLDENVITTASTTAEKASTAPATSVTLTAEDLRLYGIRSIDEAVRFLSVGVVTSDPLGTPDIGARGVLLPRDDGKHFLLLVNGHAMNDPLYGSARFDQGAGVPIDLVDHIEVIVGPGSVLYGSNAMLGVINIITKDSGDYQGGHVLTDFEPGRSVRAGAGAGVSFRMFGQPSELTTGVEYFSRFGPELNFGSFPAEISRVDGRPLVFTRGGPRDGVWGGTVRKAYFTEAPSGMVRLRSGDFEINLLASAYRRGIPYRTNAIDVDFDDGASYELDRSVRLDIRHQATLSSLVQLTSRLYADSFDYQKKVNRNASAGCLRDDFETCTYYDAGLSRWGGIEERVSLNWLGDLSFVTLLGTDLRVSKVSAKQDSLDFDTGKPFAPSAGLVNDSTVLVSPYVQQTWAPVHSVALNAGARLDADRRFSPVVSPRGAVSWSPFRKTTFRAIYSQAFRAPTWIETDSSTVEQARSKPLSPETVRSVEGSVEQRFGTQRLMFGVFRSYWRNLIELDILSQAEVAALEASKDLPLTADHTTQYQNVASIENYGWNGTWDGTLVDGRLRYGLNATEAFTQRRSDAGSEELAAAPQLFGNLHLAYAFGGLIPTPAVAVSYLGKRPIDGAFAENYRSLPYATPLAEIRGTLTGPVPAVPGLSYGVTATYVTASSSAYAVGVASLSAARVLASPVLAPIDEARIFFGIRYDFLGGASAVGAKEGQPP